MKRIPWSTSRAQNSDMRQPGLSQVQSHKWLFVAKVVIFALAYFGVARLGVLLSIVLGHNTLIWPPTGLALATLLLFGVQLWPGIALGTFLASVATGIPLAVACGVSLGNTLEALLAVFLLQRVVGFQNTLERLTDVFGLVGLAAGLSTMVSATIDVTSLCLGGVAPWEAYGVLWRVWWLGGAMSDLVVASLLLTWSARFRLKRRPWRIVESSALGVALVLVCLLIFGGWSHVALIHSPLDYAVFPFIIWAALRFSQREAMTAVFVVSTIALWGTAHEVGPFVRGPLPERLIFLYTFMSVIATTALVVAAIVTARKRMEEELQQAKETAEVANHAKSEFLATMSHELRTPLSVVLGYTELLLEDTFGPLVKKQADALGRIDRSARELLDLVTAVLDLSRLEAGRLPLTRQETQVEDLLQEVQAETRRLQEHARLTFVWEIETGLPRLDTDSGKLKVVLRNLLGNAVKFTQEGCITVAARSHDGGVELSVTDTGIGIPREALGVIFEPFRQIEHSATRQYGGTGLGLHIVKRLLEMLGGVITVESEVGRGSTFRVWMPKSQSAEERKERAA
ncbi:MAG: MASE1 domain-containing protein [Deltaproteobacteria bacterium]|nr:MASE1 domain-containing protein [Deltaproteobacteria bacterium]